MYPGPKCLRVVLIMVIVIRLGGWGEGCWEQEKLALMQLKPFFGVQLYPVSDINRYALYDWVEESSDCCQWNRIECDATTGRVIGLCLADTMVDPTFLNASLFLPFKELKRLSLGSNQIAGFLDNEGSEKLALKLKKLEVLDLSFNTFNDSSILSSLVAISSLKCLNLSYNQLSGVSTKLSGAIEILDLKGNKLDDSILLSLTELSSLKYLDLSKNHIKGSLRNNELKNLINLKELHLSNNEIKSLDSFHGVINLEVLALTLNILNNSIVSSLGPFSKCLKYLRVQYILNGYILNGSIDIKDARGLKNPKGIAANNSGLLQQSMSLFPSLKILHFESDNFINETVTTKEIRNLTNLEELYLDYSTFLHTDILNLGDVGELTSLRVLSLFDCEGCGSLRSQGVLESKNLESLKVDGIFLQDSFFENIRAMTSLKILTLRGCGLTGTLSAQDICQLTHLQELDVSNNTIRGVLPDCFSNFTLLQRLDLSSNQFDGNLLVLSPLHNLTYIDLSYNQFQIPSSLEPFFNHSKLKHFSGDNNNITYEETKLHSSAPKFQLNFISLSCCGDAGPLPNFLHHQHELQSVGLSNINLTGEFPSWLLENNTKLERLALINNSFLGPFQLPFHSTMKLLELDVSSNFINGHIPIDIGVYLPGLMILNISRNCLDGSIPSSIGDMKSLQKLDLSNNRLSGVIPENLAAGCSFLKFLVLSNNILQGQIFSTKFNLTNLRQLHLAGNNFTGSIPNSLSNCSLLETIKIGYNHLSGRIPKWMGNLSSLSEIIMPNNQIEGPIPMEFCQLAVIEVLDLNMNNISGTLPSCFRESFISHVHLSKNRLQGPIPNEICKIFKLVTLDLSDNQLTGNIPNCIGNLSDLSYIVLRHNNLEGEIPNQFCQLNKLKLIDISHNNLSGCIPTCLNVTGYDKVTRDSNHCSPFHCIGFPNLFGTNESIELTTKSRSYSYKGRILRYMSGIDLSSNKLTGEIPHEMGNFHKILMLNLSHNSLVGPIPPSLSNITEIESLDLSYNNLSGSIPPQFVELYFLAYFNVSYNNLSGKPPPRIAQFASDFDENSYWGNPFLCGEPLPKNCSTTNPFQPTEDGENGGLIDIEAFYVTFIVSYIVVLLCFAAIMYINPYWRRAWFYLIERGITSCFYFVIDNLPTEFRCGNI